MMAIGRRGKLHQAAEETETERGRRAVVEEFGDTKASRGPTCPWQRQRWNRAKEEEVCLPVGL